jgi:hypothetical protein
VSDTHYCDHCHHTKHCFGCVGLNRKEYCILNKQYTKEEYEKLVPQIISHMRKNNEWGELIPITFSIHGYNETLAQDHYPLTKEQVLAHGWKWLDELDEVATPKSPTILPDAIANVGDDICKGVFTCEISHKPYKIIPQELDFYRQLNVPLPTRSFFQRHKDRMDKRNPRKLWNRQCAKCAKGIQTTYASERPEQIYCEECYLKEVY